MATHADTTALTDALTHLRDELSGVRLALAAPGADQARATRDELVGQIDDYLLPRLRQMDAPLLMVVGGSTGAGKSTLVNSLVGAEVSSAGVLRPTTRAPVLVCHPDDVSWFQDDRILPSLHRSTGAPAGAGGLQLVATDAVPPGLGLLDAPDIDSVVVANRELAGQLLAAADAWLFVTTAARYADAVPWDMLHAARERGTGLAVVLNRVPPEAIEEVAAHLREMLGTEGLGDAAVLVVPETRLQDERLPPAALAPVRDWFDALAADAQARGTLVRRTLDGALASVVPRVHGVATTLTEQLAAATRLGEAVQDAFAGAHDEIEEAVKGGALLRGEVLARWHEVVGTGDLMRALESRVGWLRDRIRATVTGRKTANAELETAVQTGVDALVQTAADKAAERAVAAWRHDPAGRALLGDDAGALDGASPQLAARTAEEVRAWQGHVFDLVREEGADKRSTARLASLGVNGAGLVVMVGVFASTGGLTGAEVVVAGGTSALSQKVLEAIFGDQAVRALAARARTDLLTRVDALLAEESARFTQRLQPLAPAPEDPERLRAALVAIEQAQ